MSLDKITWKEVVLLLILVVPSFLALTLTFFIMFWEIFIK